MTCRTAVGMWDCLQHADDEVGGPVCIGLCNGTNWTVTYGTVRVVNTCRMQLSEGWLGRRGYTVNITYLYGFISTVAWGVCVPELLLDVCGVCVSAWASLGQMKWTEEPIVHVVVVGFTCGFTCRCNKKYSRYDSYLVSLFSVPFVFPFACSLMR